MAQDSETAPQAEESDDELSHVTLAKFQSRREPILELSNGGSKLLKKSFELQVPTSKKAGSYGVNPAEWRVRHVLAEKKDSQTQVLSYDVKFEDGHVEKASSSLSFDGLNHTDGGTVALARFQDNGAEEDSDVETESSDVVEVVNPNRNTVNTISSSDELAQDDDIVSFGTSSRSSTRRRSLRRRSTRQTSRQSISLQSDESDSDSDAGPRRSRRNQRARPSRAQPLRNLRSAGKTDNYELVEESTDSEEEEEELPFLTSDVLPRKRKRKMTLRKQKPSRMEIRGVTYTEKYKSRETRRSDRSTRHQRSMGEVGLDDVYRSDSDGRVPAIPKAIGAKESFKQLEPRDGFHLRHCQQCDTCGQYSAGSKSQLIHCQGCTLSYHKHCIGNRATRDHLVTKVGEEDFVLQCRRCISQAKRKDPTAPDQGLCQICRETGASCNPFRVRKTPAQEEREREDNMGKDPIVNVKKELINNVNNVMFRCTSCWRSFHLHHLPPRTDVLDTGRDDETIAEDRFVQYRRDWMCRECVQNTDKISGLVGWRPLDIDTYNTGLTTAEVNEDEKEYLVKWDQRSYFRAQWMPGAWVWGITAAAMRKAFARRNDGNNLPTMSTEEAIPEDYLRIDIILEVKYTSFVGTQAEEVDKARVREVKEALTKYKGLGYEDAVWETVPGPEDGERWTDFVKAYDDWVMRRYVRIPKPTPLKLRTEKARSTSFQSLEKEKQPEHVVGGELMKYQLEGMNWLFYRWHQKKNAILADEMGLGKTIQIICLFALLVHDFNCFPFLIVVPNSTVPNWRREIKQWAPSLRVVTYFGSSVARKMAYEHEMYPEGSKELRCHVVVTSYDAAADEGCSKVFKNVPWQGLIVDEGQRLKNDRGILYNVLSSLKIPFRILLTGTPLQNNARELFNLLQFTDDSFDAEQMDLNYAELTRENIPQLHSLIRPFFLRRTKAQVLTFLPPMAQVIVPVSMSLVQSKLYSSILARNAALVKAIFDSSSTVKTADKTNLNNILMQLRKCLCHPFVYSREIEERNVDQSVLHKNLVDASGKLRLLEILLPKLKARGHRVLIFSQFLDELAILEDFMDGLMLRYQRLDGTVSSLQKQKRIDEFNNPDSPLFAFLLSTRAGGVGINLATADTVIIMDPDFNPHQDIQALSRAHRIGQKKKVLCFQLMTKGSVEEKIVQIGRKKMALDHVLIERMDAEEDAGVDVESILRHGAAEILGGETREIRYDDASVEKLLDRSQIEETKAAEDNSAESQFSFARVWANDAASMMDSLDSSDDEERAPDTTTWDKILKERERLAAEEAAKRQQDLGRGKRARQTVDYATDDHQLDSTYKIRRGALTESDTDFMAHESEDHDTDEGDEDDLKVNESGQPVNGIPQAIQNQPVEATKLSSIVVQQPREQGETNEQTAETRVESSGFTPVNKPAPVINPTNQSPAKTVKFVQNHPSATTHNSAGQTNLFRRSVTLWPDIRRDQNTFPEHIACGARHQPGYCPIKLAGPEICNLCGLAHFGVARTCPHIKSHTQVEAMLKALKYSQEPEHLIREAHKYLTGVKGHLAQEKRRKAQKAAQALQAQTQPPQTHGDQFPDAMSHLRALNLPDGNNLQVISSLETKQRATKPQISDVERANAHLRRALPGLPGHCPDWLKAFE